MGRCMWTCVLVIVLVIGLLGGHSWARKPDGKRHHRTTTTTVSAASTTTSTLPPGTPPGFTMVDSALGALIGEVNAEHMSEHLKGELLKQIQHAQDNIARAADLLSMHERKQAKAVLEHAIRWMISFHYRVGSNSGRRGGADRMKLFTMVDAILSDLRALRESI